MSGQPHSGSGWNAATSGCAAYLAGELVADTRAPAAGLGGAALPRLLPARGRHQGRAGPGRADRALAQPRRGRDPRRQGGDGDRRRAAARRYPDSPLAELRDAVRLDWDCDERVARGGRAGLHPPARPVQAGRHPGQLPARPGRDRRGHRRRLPPAAHPVRDRPAAPLLPAARRPADGPAAAVGRRVPLPVQGDRRLLVGGHRAGRARATSSGCTGPRCRRARRSRGWPASTTRRSISTWTASGRSSPRTPFS